MQGSLNSELTSLGKSQATKLATKLASLNLDKIFSSTATRASQTANLIFDDQPIIHSDDLQEIAMGNWEGKTYTQIKTESPKEWFNFFKDPFSYTPSKGGESFDDLEKRLKKFIDHEQIKSMTGHIAIVSHRITLKMLISILQQDKALFNHIDLDPTSLSILTLANDASKIACLNDTTHY
ncbi:Phosphoglycerate mutase [Lactococcus piscium]|uniref:Phosphoglycerate mutase n=2 Tax=Pseudolactococcus piscium TaxID=1364 RepID=A0A2A5S5W5_9LACT|nr:Phosphoglycerate mutase [Lactococcus piscium]